MKTKILSFFIFILLIATTLPIISSSAIELINFEKLDCPDYVPGEFIVKFDSDIKITDPNIEKINQKYQVNSINKVFKNKDGTILDNIYLMKVPDEIDIIAAINDYSSKPFVQYAEPNYLLSLFNIPNDQFFNKQYGLHNIGQEIWFGIYGTEDADIDTPEAWDIEKGSQDVTIAIIDTGVDYTHPDLEGNIWINEEEIADNGIDDDNNGYIDDRIGWDFVGESIFNPEPDNDPLDDYGHGTHCSGIASAVTDNGIGVAGVSWYCKIMCLRVAGTILGKLNSDAAVESIVYATDNGANVISMSWGGTTPKNSIKDALDYAYENNVVLIAASGNDPFSDKFYPAAYENVIAVAASDWDDNLALFSTFGNWVDVTAPGFRIYSTMPTYNVVLNLFGMNKNYDFMDGTSMSCPMVAGLAGLLISYNLSLTNEEVRDFINTASDWINTDDKIANGRINAHKALLIASGVSLPPNKPSIFGPTDGNKGTEYTYNTSANTDPDGDDLYYLFDWDDSTFSDWVGPFASGEKGSASHKWNKQGNYQIRVKARDSYGIESPWSDSLSVTMPRNQAINTPFLNFLQQYPILYQLLLRFLRL